LVLMRERPHNWSLDNYSAKIHSFWLMPFAFSQMLKPYHTETIRRMFVLLYQNSYTQMNGQCFSCPFYVSVS